MASIYIKALLLFNGSALFFYKNDVKSVDFVDFVNVLLC